MPGLTDRQTEITVFFTLLGGHGGASPSTRPAGAAPATRTRLEEWGVGGRAFGNWVTWFLIGGASYTAYTFIAVPSLTWGNGAFGFYAVPFALVTTPLVFLMSPRIWSVSHAHGFITYGRSSSGRGSGPGRRPCWSRSSASSPPCPTSRSS